MKKFTLEVEGKTDSDIELSIDEAARRFKAGFTEGFDRGDAGRFSFKVEGEEESDMLDFSVEWQINLSAKTPEDAAKEALEIMRDPQSHATTFDVYDDNGDHWSIDPLEPKEIDE